MLTLEHDTHVLSRLRRSAMRCLPAPRCNAFTDLHSAVKRENCGLNQTYTGPTGEGSSATVVICSKSGPGGRASTLEWLVDSTLQLQRGQQLLSRRAWLLTRSFAICVDTSKRKRADSNQAGCFFTISPSAPPQACRSASRILICRILVSCRSTGKPVQGWSGKIKDLPRYITNNCTIFTCAD